MLKKDSYKIAPRWLEMIGIVLLSGILFISAIGVVYQKHQSRQLFTKLQYLQQEVESLQVEWSQLLLEQGTWAADSRVMRHGKESLKMTLPEPNEVVVVAQ